MFFKDNDDAKKNTSEKVLSENERLTSERLEQEGAMQEHLEQEAVMSELASQELASQELASQELASQELAACKQESAQWKEQYLRLRADFDNFSKRVDRERKNIALFAQSEILLDILAVIDDFDRALEQKQGVVGSEALAQGVVAQEVDSWRAGIEMIRASLDKVLESYDVKPMIDYAAFNPTLHEAISQVPVAGKAAGTIVHVAQKGYLRNGTVLRPAKVVVAQ